MYMQAREGGVLEISDLDILIYHTLKSTLKFVIA